MMVNRVGRIRNPVATSLRLLRRKVMSFIRWVESPVLDIGAGYGQYADYLEELGYYVDAVEPDEKMRNPDRMYSMKLNHYRTSLLINVLHHAKDPVRLVMDYSRFCDILIISELNPDSWLVRNYHRLFVRDEVGTHLRVDDVLDMIPFDFELRDTITQGLGPFRDVWYTLVVVYDGE